MRPLHLTFLAFALAVGFFLLRSCFAGDEGQIRAQLRQLESLVSFEAGEGNLQSVGRAKQLSELFAQEVTIDIRAGGPRISQTGSRQEVMQAALAARSQLGSLEASLYDITVEVAAGGSRATVEATGRARISGQDSSVVEDFILSFRKTEAGWLIERAENAQTFR